jgi:hypothetical protein
MQANILEARGQKATDQLCLRRMRIAWSYHYLVAISQERACKVGVVK